MGKQIILYFLLAGLSLSRADVVQGERSNRILEGNVAAEGEFPYAVSIQMLGAPQLTNTRGHKCSGALISLQHVVTTAVCLYDFVQNVPVPINPTQYRVFAGATVLTNDTTDRVRGIVDYVVHPRYTGPPAFVNNIAVLTLASPFAKTVVRPISLPSSNFAPADFTLCTVTGWGAYNRSTPYLSSVRQRYATKYVYNQDVCTGIFNTIEHSPNILPSMICAASYDLLSSNCFGDDGNSLVCNGVFTGVLSVGHQCELSSFPEIYTRISNYTTWIRGISGAGTTCSHSIFTMITVFSIIQIYLSM
ncbi:transmembrane protease serine 9-like [Nymphalis io]|uniref:transmembrane protease serine 9-like n=1 Tax=Inachis io TaxID=171585 RepID=UPI0021695B74|nr:transmembrane protease serine 9-like [Nymphalis io]